MTSAPFSLPSDLVEQARKEREQSSLSTIGSDIDSTVSEGMGALKTIAGGYAEQLAPALHLLSGGELKMPSLDDLTPSWIKDQQRQAQQGIQNALALASQSSTTSQPTQTSVNPRQPTVNSASGTPAAMPTGAGSSTAGDGSPPGPLTGSDRPARIASALPYAQQAEQRTGVPADVNLAFAVHESGLEDRYGPGMSYHGRHAVGDEPGTPITDWGYDANGNRVDYPTKLKSYSDASGSFSDFADLIANSPLYQPALQRYQQSGDKDQLIRDIWAAGYGESKTGPDETVNIRQNQTANVQPAPGVPNPSKPSQTQPNPAQLSNAPASTYTQQGLADAGDPNAWTKCGPVAAFQFALKMGRPPTQAEVERLAVDAGWTPQNGMAGLQSEANLLKGMGIAAHATRAVDWDAVITDVSRGNPVLLELPGHEGHYVTAQGYDPATGKIDFGSTVGDLRAANHRTAFTPAEFPSLGWGSPSGALFLDNPATPAPSVVAGQSASPTPVASSRAAGPAPADAIPSASAGASNQTLTDPDSPAAPAPAYSAPAGRGGGGVMSLQRPADPPPYDPRDVDQGPHEWRPEWGQANYPMDQAGRPYPTGSPAVGSWPGDSSNPLMDDNGQGAPAPYVPDRTDPTLQPRAVPNSPYAAPGRAYGAADDAMYRQPLGATAGPDTTPDAPPQSTYNDPTAGGTISQPLPPQMQASSDTAGPSQDAVEQQGREISQQPQQPDVAIGSGTAPNDQTNWHVTPTAPPPTPQQQPAAPPSGFPGLQAVYDSAGNFLHWIQGAAQGVQNQVDSQMAGPVRSTPGEPDYAPPYNPVQKGLNDIANEGIATPIGRGLATGINTALGRPTRPGSGGPETSIDTAITQTARSLPANIAAAQQGYEQGNWWQAGLGALGAIGDLAPSTTLARQLNEMLPKADTPVGEVGAGDVVMGAALLHGGVNAIRATPALVRGAAALGYGALQEGGRIADKIAQAISEGVPAEQFSQWLNTAANTIDQGIGAARGAISANAARVAAPGEAGPFTTAAHVVPPHVADTLDFPVRVPTDPPVVRAIEAAGGSVDPERGVTLNVTRAQGPASAGQTAARGGVFYEAVPEGGRSSFVRGSDEATGVGGTQVIPPTPTRFRSPLIISDAPGSTQGFDDGMRQLGSMNPPVGYGEIQEGIREARAAGPEGSPARAQALKDVVSRYGGDPALIEPLLRIRGADASESQWAIKENILAANARRAGHDGVITVQPHGPDEALVEQHPKVVAAKQTLDEATQAYSDAIDAHQAAYERVIPQQFVRGKDESLAAWFDRVPSEDPAYQAALSRAQEHPSVIAAQQQSDRAAAATTRAETAYTQANTDARAELGTHKITELMDPREANNPTPGATNPRIAEAQQALQTAWQQVSADMPPDHPAVRAVGDARDALERLQRGEPTVGEPGYTLRSDIPRRPDAPVSSAPQTAVAQPNGWGMIDAGPGLAERAARLATVPAAGQDGAVAGAAVGGVTGAAQGDENTTWDQRLRNGLLGAGIGLTAGGAIAAHGTLGAARLIDSLISSGKLNPEILLSHPEPVTRIKALFGLAAEGLPDNAPVSVPGMAQFIARLHPAQVAELGPLLSGSATAGEVRQVVQQSLGQRFGQAVSEIVSDAVTGLGARGSRAAETRADTATVRGLPSALQGIRDARPSSSAVAVPTAFGPATETTNPEITRVVGQVARDLGIEPPRVFVSNSSEVNAAVMSGPQAKPVMVLTKGLGDANLTPDEMRALLTHEMSHAAESTAGNAAPVQRAFGASPGPKPNLVPTPEEIKAAEQAGAARGVQLNREVAAPESSIPRSVRLAQNLTDDKAAQKYAEDILTTQSGRGKLPEYSQERPSLVSRANPDGTSEERFANELEGPLTTAARHGLQHEMPQALQDIHERDVLEEFYRRGHQGVMDARQPVIDAAKARGADPALIARMEAKATTDAEQAGLQKMAQRSAANGDLSYTAVQARLQAQEARIKATGPEAEQAFTDALQAVWDHNRQTLKRAVEADGAGGTTQEAYDLLTERYPHYVPTVPLSKLGPDLERAFGGNGPSIGRGGAGVSAPLTKMIREFSDVASGSDRLNPIVASRNATIVRERQIARNNNFAAFARMVEDAQAVGAPAADQPNALRRIAGDTEVHGFIQGKPVSMMFARPVAEAIDTAGALGMDGNAFAKLWMTAKNWITQSITGRRGSFLLVNMVRDFGDFAGITAGHEGGPQALPKIVGAYAANLAHGVADVGRGLGARPLESGVGFAGGAILGDQTHDPNDTLAQRARRDLEYGIAGAALTGGRNIRPTGASREFLARGGGMGVLSPSVRAGERWLRDVNEAGGAVVRSPAELGQYLKDWGWDTLTLKSIARLNDVGELVPRTAAMQLAERRGATPLEAMVYGRDATMDFMRGGQIVKQINKFIPFFNASVQGKAQLARMFRDHPYAASATFAATVAPLVVGVEAYNRMDPQRAQAYADVPDYEKQNGLVMMLPWAGSDQRGELPNHLFIPVGNYAPLIAQLRDTMRTTPGLQDAPAPPGEAPTGNAATDVRVRAQHIFGEALSALNPVGGDTATGVVSGAIPPVAKQAIEIGTNQNLYTGAPIASAARDEAASAASQGIAGGLNRLGQMTGNQGLQNVRPGHVEYGLSQAPALGDLVQGVSNAVAPTPYRQASNRPIQNEPVAGGLASRFVRDTHGENLRRAEAAMFTPDLQSAMTEAGLRPDQVTPVSNRIGQVPLMRDEQLDWQNRANDFIDQEVAAAQRSPAYNAPNADQGSIIQKALAKAKDRAAQEILRQISPAEQQQRIREAADMKAAS